MHQFRPFDQSTLEIKALTLGCGGIQMLNRVSFEVAPGSITLVIEAMYAGGPANA